MRFLGLLERGRESKIPWAVREGERVRFPELLEREGEIPWAVREREGEIP